MGHGRRDVVAGILQEKAAGLEQEADVGGRHHRIILGAGEVRVAEGVPEHDVGILDRRWPRSSGAGRRRPGSGWDSSRPHGAPPPGRA